MNKILNLKMFPNSQHFLKKISKFKKNNMNNNHLKNNKNMNNNHLKNNKIFIKIAQIQTQTIYNNKIIKINNLNNLVDNFTVKVSINSLGI